jgi:hypothetical protein
MSGNTRAARDEATKCVCDGCGVAASRPRTFPPTDVQRVWSTHVNHRRGAIAVTQALGLA